MNWKAYIASSISSLLVIFPQNIIGCGGGSDPYDYYTSFFHQHLPGIDSYQPFYYTANSFLYDPNEPVALSELLSKEWASYCGNKVTAADAQQLVYTYDRKDLLNLYLHIETGTTLKIPDSVMRNSMSNYFKQAKDLEALGYLLFAKQVEPFVTGNSNDWEPLVRDTAKMAKLLKNGLQLSAASKKDFFKLKYGYQVTRLAHYSGRYREAIALYDSHVATTATQSVLQPLSLALKAGALYKTGDHRTAAYIFSKAFQSSNAKKVSNYLGFKWSTQSVTNKESYLALCKSPEEKAGMLSLFALGSTGDELSTLREVYRLHPGSVALEVLMVREINKLEEKYFTPGLQKQQGGSTFYYYWQPDNAAALYNDAGKEAAALAGFLHEAASGKQLVNPGLFEAGAAYCAYMLKDYANAKKYLAAAQRFPLSAAVKDQCTLTQLLVTINEKATIDAGFEEDLFPSMRWLEQRVQKEQVKTKGYYEPGQWQKIYRDLLSEILARRYHQAGEFHKEALCIGAADRVMLPGTELPYGRGIDFMRDKLDLPAVEKLVSLLTSNRKTNYEQFLVKGNSITLPLAIDFAGTACLRNYEFGKAIEWFKKLPAGTAITVNKNAFIDLLYDQEEPLAVEKNSRTGKSAFATTMLSYMQQAATDKNKSAGLYYKLALGFYNITYYGHTWELVAYQRSGSDGYHIPKNASAFQKEYYGCYTAHAYFEKAMNASVDANFKARCLFMMAKCSQKQVPKPLYSDFNYNYNQLDKAEKAYWTNFKKNNHFPQLVKEYNNTPFYKEAYNRCSFLRDFVRKK